MGFEPTSLRLKVLDFTIKLRSLCTYLCVTFKHQLLRKKACVSQYIKYSIIYPFYLRVELRSCAQEALALPFELIELKYMLL